MRKRLFLFFPAVFCAWASVFLIQTFLFPFVYGIKEPFFAMPIQIHKKVAGPGGLPVRSDAYGHGHFGAKRKAGRKHTGLDMAAKLESPVRASKSGWARTGYIPRGYGNLVIINHPGGWQTRYGHLSRHAIKKSQWVRQGDIIGFVGNTGNARSRGITPHLHFEMRYKDMPVNPAEKLLEKVRG